MRKRSTYKLGLSSLIGVSFLLGACGFNAPTNDIKAEVDFNNTTLLAPKVAKVVEELRLKGEEVYIQDVGKGQKTDGYLTLRLRTNKNVNDGFRIKESLDASGVGTARTAGNDLDAFRLYLTEHPSGGLPAPPAILPMDVGPFDVPASPLANQVVVFTNIPNSTVGMHYYALAAALKETSPGNFANINSLGSPYKMDDGQRVEGSTNSTDVTGGTVNNPAPLSINIALLNEHNAIIETDITVNDGTAGPPPGPGAF